MNQNEFNNLLNWITEKSKNLKYGEISIVLKMHNGEIRHIEKLVKENELPESMQTGNGYGKY